MLSGFSFEPPVGSVLSEWDALADTVGADPFTRPGWTQAWWRSFGRGRLALGVVRRGSRLVAVAPVRRWAGTLSSPTNYHTPAYSLLAEDAAAADALGAGLVAAGRVAVRIAYLEGSDAGLAAVRTAVAARRGRLLVSTVQRSPYVTLDGGDVEARLRPGRRSDLRRCRRRLAERGGLALAVARDSGALRELERIEALGWKGDRGTAIASTEVTQRFYRDVATWAERRGELRLFSLLLDGHVAAVMLGLRAGRTLHLVKGGFDPALAPLSPGRVLLADALAATRSEGMSRVELLGQAEPYKLEWADGVRERVLVHAFPGTPAGAAARLAVVHGRPALVAARARWRRRAQ